MNSNYQYTMLICSLPAFAPLLKAQQTPLSRIQLNQRLKILAPQDCDDIEYLGALLDWFHQPLKRTDSEFLSIVKISLPKIANPFIREQIEWRLSLRTLVAALRYKQLKQSPPVGEQWGFSRWLPIVEKHWHEPTFGLEKMLPWLGQVNRLLTQDKAAELEKFILELVWKQIDQAALGHEFDLEAVAIYRMRWDLVARWTCYAKQPALERFNSLVSRAMTDFDQIM